MGYSIIRYLRNFPLRYYLKGGIAQMHGSTISLFLSAQQSAALVCRGRRAQGFELEVMNLLGAPPLNGVDSAFAPGSRSFSQKLLARSRARGVPRYIFVPDLTSSDLYCNVHSVTNLRELTWRVSWKVSAKIRVKYLEVGTNRESFAGKYSILS